MLFVVVDSKPGSIGEGVQDGLEINDILSCSTHQDESGVGILEHRARGIDQGVSDRGTIFD